MLGIAAALLFATVAAPAMSAQTTGAPTVEVPGGLLFGFYRVFAFHERAAELKCKGPEREAADRSYDDIRKRLIARYGSKSFSPAKPVKFGAGDCRIFMTVYTRNIDEYRKVVDAALAPVPSAGS